MALNLVIFLFVLLGTGIKRLVPTYLALALPRQPRLATDLEQSFCLSLTNSGITTRNHYIHF